MKAFPLILITSPEDFADEHVLLEAMFQRGLSRLHIRKPRKDSRALERWIMELDASLRPMMVVHGHPDLLHAFGLSGFHGPEGTSASFHSFAEIDNLAQEYEYGFLSPIFDSLSKPDYSAAFTAQQIQMGLAHWKSRADRKVKRIFALGGIDAEHLPQIHQWGFAGAGILGAIWNAADPLRAWDELFYASCVVANAPLPEFSPIESWRDTMQMRRGGNIRW